MGLFSKNSNAPKPVESQIPTSVIASPPEAARPQDSSSLPPASSAAMIPVQISERQIYLEKMKVRIHQQLVERLDVQNLRTVPQDQVRAEVRSVIRDLCQLEKGLLTSSEQERLMDEVMDETFGLGPLEAMFKDPTITDILINRYDRVYVERLPGLRGRRACILAQLPLSQRPRRWRTERGRRRRAPPCRGPLRPGDRQPTGERRILRTQPEEHLQ